jgi:predicted AAA+ superfamily ATPase
VLNGLLNNFTASADRIGGLFEHLLFNQLLDSAAARDVELRLSSYRTEHGAEVDFILERPSETIAVEAKASTTIPRVDARGFRSFADYYGKRHRRIIAYLGHVRKIVDGIELLPWQALMKELQL